MIKQAEQEISPRDFCLWLRGFLDIADAKGDGSIFLDTGGLTGVQLEVVLRKLVLVDLKVGE